MNQPRAKCLFCDGGVSDEHFWPQWSHSLFEKAPSNKFESKTQYYKGVTPRGRTIVKQKNGNAFTKTLRAVCRNCNGGWMSRLETAAKPYFIDLIPGKACILGNEAADILTKWVVLKAMVSEHQKRETAIFTQNERITFKNNLTLPPNIIIWIGQCGEPGWKLHFNRYAGHLGIEGVYLPTDKSIQSITLTFGQVFFQLTHIAHECLSHLVPTYEDCMDVLYPYPCMRLPINWPTKPCMTKKKAAEVRDQMHNQLLASHQQGGIKPARAVASS